ncbi:MAG TPA: BglII/BstYI family type II restriction endonuclease [Paracoccaceae bacterium]|nr:BglII/BstYI family type II restriction endonuclease [Paracoccaceae bacterium]
MLDRLRQRGFDLLVRNHAAAVLAVDFPDETAELVMALSEFTISIPELIGSGGGEAASTQRLRRRLADCDWLKHKFVLETKIDGALKEATGHEIDHVRRGAAGTIALEIEWNNKDPFFDRDLESFQRLHAQSVISVGVIVTRGASLHTQIEPLIRGFIEARGIVSADELVAFGMKRRTDRQSAALQRMMGRGIPFAAAFARTFVQDKFGEATTHWRKLEGRVARGVGNPCPLLLIGLPAGVVQA